jgi:RNA polymerase sigma-70 factor (ECF subfamily)
MLVPDVPSHLRLGLGDQHEDRSLMIADRSWNESLPLDAIESRWDDLTAPVGFQRQRDVQQRDYVELAQNGDHDAFGVLAGAAFGRLSAAARLICRDSELARDAVQEAFIRAWVDLPTLRDPERFDAWLHRLLVHACLDELRRRRRRVVEVELTDIHHPPIADAASETAERDAFARGFRRLDATERALVVLHHYLGLSMPEAAAALAIPLGTAKSRLNRALSTLRAALDADARPGALAGDVA